MNILLWIIQVLLALLFLYGGIFKLVANLDEAAKFLGVSVLFLRFIGLCEALGGLGLLLPGLFRIKTGLTALAAAGLAVITAGATVITLKSAGIGPAVLPFITCLLCIAVAYGRWRMRPIAGK